MNKPLLIKRIASLASVFVLSVAIVLTAFVFDGKKKGLNTSETDNKKTSSSSATTVTETETGTKKSEIVTTTPPLENENIKPPETTTTKTAETEKTTETTKKAEETEQGFYAEAVISNTWQENNQTRSQVDVVLKNNSENAVDGWRAVVSFDGEASVVDSWNGVFSADLSEITVAPAQYNSTVAPETEISFGMILSSEKELEILAVSVE